MATTATTPATNMNIPTSHTTNPPQQQHQQQQQQTSSSQKQPKRPATYIKVIDLAQSYNIDAEKVKAEIHKINTAKREAAAGGGVTHKSSLDGKDDSHSMISKVTDDSVCSGDKKHHGGGGGTAKGYPKRFSAMNGGFNLCL